MLDQVERGCLRVLDRKWNWSGVTCRLGWSVTWRPYRGKMNKIKHADEYTHFTKLAEFLVMEHCLLGRNLEEIESRKLQKGEIIVQHSVPVIKWSDKKYMSYLSLLNCWVPVVYERGNGNRSLHVHHNQYLGGRKKGQLPQMYLVQPTSEVGTPMRRSYIVPMMWVVI